MIKTPLTRWLFTKEGRTEEVALPHCWNRAEEGSAYYRGACLYRSDLYLEPRPGRVYYVEFEAAASLARLEVNGRAAGEHRGGFSAFRFNITDYLLPGMNALALTVDNSHREDIYPLMADFAFMGGLYRPAWFIEAETSRISLDDHGSEGVYVRQGKFSRNRVDFEVEVPVTRPADGPGLSCRCRILSPEGETVLKEKRTVKGDGALFAFSLEKPRLWEGRPDPALYTVEISLREGKREIDSRRVTTGFRRPRVSRKRGFFLNGRPYPLRGVSRHQDRDGRGWAVTEEDEAEDLALIGEMGANAVRLAHYQHSRSFYDRCDGEGFLVWAEIPYISRTSREDRRGTNALSQLEELIRQNYNRPSICFWGLQNEITIGTKKEWAEKITLKLHRLAKKLDPVRLTAQAQVGHYPDGGPLNGVTDCLGYNKYYGWYYGEVSDLDRWIGEFTSRKKHPPLGITEYGAEGLTAWHSDRPRKEDYTEEYLSRYHEETLAVFRRHPELWGTFVWNMFDFASPLRDEGGVKGMNNKGLVSYDRKVKKDAFYWYKAHWSDEPMVHITGKRYRRRRGRYMEAAVYSNQETLILEVNGRERDRAHPREGKAVFSRIPLKGRGITALTVRGRDGVGRETCSDRASFVRVRRADPSYVCPEKDPFHFLKNWFEEEPPGEAPPLEFPEGFLSVREKIRLILKYPAGEEIIRKYAGPLYDHPMFSMVKGFSPEKLTELRPGVVPPSFLGRVNGELILIKKVDRIDKKPGS